MGPSFPLPTKQNQVGLWQLQKPKKLKPSVWQLGDKAERVPEKERILGESSNCIRADPQASDLCNGGRDDSPSPNFSEILLSE